MKLSNSQICLTQQPQRPTVLYRQTQQGATLIVVLLFLILVMIAGAMAVKQSNTDLKLATSDQINTTLLQSSDSANQSLEKMANSLPNSPQYKLLVVSPIGAFGHFLYSRENKGDEFVYCYNPRRNNYSARQAIVKKAGGGTQLNASGYCDYETANDYTNARQTVMTQMNITTTPTVENDDPFKDAVIGKDSSNSSSQKTRFDIYSTSSLPAYNTPKDGAHSCYESTMIEKNKSVSGNNNQSLTDCLKQAQTPHKALYEQAVIENKSRSTTCIKFGSASSNRLLCTL